MPLVCCTLIKGGESHGDWAGLLLLLLLHNSSSSVTRSLLQLRRVVVVVVDAVALVFSSSHLLLLPLSRVFSSGVSSLAACLDSLLNKASADSALSKALDSGGGGGGGGFFFGLLALFSSSSLFGEQTIQSFTSFLPLIIV